MSLLYEFVRLFGVREESKELERLISEASPFERREALLRLKPLIDRGPPKESDFRYAQDYEDAQQIYNARKACYDKLHNGQC